MRRLAAGLLCGCLLGCPDKAQELDAGVADAGPVLLTEKEPDDRPEQANPITQSAVITGSLSADPSKPDEDWYRVAAPVARAVDLSVSGIPGGDVMLEVMDADRNRIALVNSEGEGKPERLPNLTVRGTALVRISSARKGTGGAYTLTALFSEPTVGTESEPNDRAVDATPLSLGPPVTGFLGHAADEDWYRVELPPAPGGAPPPPPPLPVPDDGGAASESDGGEMPPPEPEEVEVPKVALKLDLAPVPGVRFDLSVLSAAEAPLFQVKGKEGEGLSLRNVGVRATDQVVYVVVKSSWGGTGKKLERTYSATTPYQLTVAQEEAGANAEYEPNDELQKATPLPRNGYKEGFLSPKLDVDYYVLHTETPVLAKLQLTGVERVDLALALIKPASETGPETVTMRVNDGAIKEPELVNNVLCAGACYFRVEGVGRKVDGKLVRDFENAQVPYRLSVTTVADDGREEREPNNTVEQATALAIGPAVRGTIHPKRDVDFYRLDLSARPVKTALTATVIGILKVDVGLYLHRVDEEGKLSLVQTSDRAKGEAPETIRYSAEPGVYVLEVRDAKNRESNFQDSYQLSVQEGE